MKTSFSGIILVLLIQLGFVLSYKEYLFKTCSSSGFCHRNREFARNVQRATNFVPQYAIDPESVEVDPELYVIKGQVLKHLAQLGKSVQLPFELTLLDKNNVRFQIFEDRSTAQPKNALVNTARYNETTKWSFKTDQVTIERVKDEKVIKDENHVSFQFGKDGKYRAELSYSPVRLVIYAGDEAQLVMNDNNFLNYEHFRTENENSKHLSPYESDFDMFSESFKETRHDKIPMGPESISSDFTFKGFKHVYGIPEHADSFNLKDTTGSDLPYRLFNVDIFEYVPNSRMPMYGSIPFLLALKPGVSVGLFWINSADTFIDINKKHEKDTSTHWMSENGVFDVVLTVGERPEDINESYGSLTGYVQLPPLFSLGYHQCRWNYNDEKDVLNINSLFDEHQIPYDVIWLDVDYADSRKYFTWQPEKFPDPEGMLKELDITGRNLVLIIDTHLKTGYLLSDTIREKEITIKDSENKTFVGQCWPGEAVWLDSMNPASQEFWDEQHALSDENTFMGRFSTNFYIWNDMNEPSIFDGIETTSLKSNLHYGNWEHRSVHNVFGLTFHEATYKALVKRLESTERQRPFILTRSFYAGSQRTAAMWTGDNMSKWEYLKASIPMVLTLGVSGMPFAGADVGGFFGDPSKELLTRWYQTGIWYPFFRAHAHIDSRRREPWVPGGSYTSIIRDAIRLRYALLPMWYTSFFESSQTGVPVLKPTFYDNLNNIESYDIEDQFYLGNSGILVKPVTDEGASSTEIYLPDEQIYYDFTGGCISNRSYQLTEPGFITKDVLLADIPMLLKGGSIVAAKNRYRRSSRLMANDPYTLTVALDKDGDASGRLYVDDGSSFNYERGEYLYLNFTANKTSIASTAENNSAFAESLGNIKVEKLQLLGRRDITEAKAECDGETWNLSFKTEGANTIVTNPKLPVNKNWTVHLQSDGSSQSAEEEEKPKGALSSGLLVSVGAILASSAAALKYFSIL